MSGTFRVKVRVKKLKPYDGTEWLRRAQEQYQQTAKDAWKQPYLPSPPTRCPSCGLPRRHEYAPMPKSGGLIYKQPEGLAYQTWN